MLRETVVTVDDLVAPLFVTDGTGVREPIDSMPGQFRWSIDLAIEECRALHELGVPAIALFPAIDASLKNPKATEALNPDGLYPNAIRAIKDGCPDLVLISDIALDPYSSDGHDGLVVDGEIDNDATLPVLADMAVLHGRAGADFVGPSDMMDGRVAAIRERLDAEGLPQVGIVAYSAKYASALYGPFREALASAPAVREGIPRDKRTYQLDPANVREAVREAALDIEEGADIVLVKPGLPYLDVIRSLHDRFPDIPIAVYNVSGEYAMVKAAAANGWLDERSVVIETLTAFKRAGADLILTYHAKDVAGWLRDGAPQH